MEYNFKDVLNATRNCYKTEDGGVQKQAAEQGRILKRGFRKRGNVKTSSYHAQLENSS